MSYPLQLEYLRIVFARYKNANKAGRTLILNEFCATTSLSRKHSIRLLRRGESARTRRPGPAFKYDRELLLRPIEILWRAMGEVNSKKLQAGMAEWLTHIPGSEHEPLFTPIVCQLLASISCSTLERILSGIRAAQKRGKTSTRPNKRFYNHIPIQAKDWNVIGPGVIQADTVAHCGDALIGAFGYSLTLTDIFSGWTENRAIWTKGMHQVIDALRSIEQKLPFTIHTFKTDSGSEFMNHRFQYYLENREPKIRMVRSRPYRKDDNCYVEQKNFTHVRELFGYARINTPELVCLMNEIYERYWNPLQNFFIPSTKLLRKTRIGARIKKEFEPHATPYDRLLRSKDLTEEQRQKLIDQKKKLNPFELSQALNEKLREFFAELKRQRLGRA